MLSAWPELVGVYIGDMVTNLYYTKSIPEMLEVSDSNVLVVYRTKKLKPWSNF